MIPNKIFSMKIKIYKRLHSYPHSYLLAVGPIKVRNSRYGWGNQPLQQHGSPNRQSKGVWWTQP